MLALLGFGTFFVVSLVVGVRLVLLWRRTRELPELLIGIGVLGIGPVGFALAVGGQLLAPVHAGIAMTCVALGQLASNGGAFAKCVFNWRVYHPDSRGVQLLVAAAALVFIAVYAELASKGFPASQPGLRSLPLIAALLWGSGEALRYWMRMRKRAKVGLGDPLVENRFLLWGLAAGSAGLGSAFGMFASFGAGGANALLNPVVLGVLSLHGLTAAICMWLAFLPPQVYLRWVTAADPATG